MADPLSAPSPAAALEARDPRRSGTWLRLSDALVAGIHHALNNRIASISGLGHLLASGAGGDEVRHALDDELRKLEATSRLLYLLPRGGDAVDVPLRVEEVLHGAVALVQHHRELRDVRFVVAPAGDLPPVLADEPSLAHALLAVLAEAASAGAAGGQVSLRLEGSRERVTLRVTPVGAPVDPDVEALVHAAGARVEALEGGWTLAFPTLESARASGR